MSRRADPRRKKDKPRRKKDKKKHAKGRQPLTRSPSKSLQRTLDHVYDLIGRRQLDEACRLLEAEDHKRVGYPDLLFALLDVYDKLGKRFRFCIVADRLIKLCPHDPNNWLMLASGYLKTMSPMLAHDAFQHFLGKWPDHAMASSVQTTANQAKAALADIMEQMNLGSDEFDVALDHDRILLSLRANEFETLTKVARRLIERKPDFRPAWTNLTEALFQLGRLHEALDTAQRTVEKFPESGYAVCNLARLLYISGDQQAAREIADRIPDTADPTGQDVVSKRAELYGLLGDLDAILALDKEVERVSLEPPNAVVLHHMVAVAHFRNGDIENARQE